MPLIGTFCLRVSKIPAVAGLVLLGGLINGTEDRSRMTVPGADKLPLFGKLIGTTGGIATRTEMIVFITPTIIRNGDEAARTSQNLRDSMKNLNFN